MAEKFMKICKVTGLVFSQFIYKNSFIAGGKLPYCPCCDMSPYDEEYELTHEEKQNEHS